MMLCINRFILGMNPNGTCDLLSALRIIFETDQIFEAADQCKRELVHAGVQCSWHLFIVPTLFDIAANDVGIYLIVSSFPDQDEVCISKTSDSGPSEIETVYNRPLNKGHCLRSQIFTLPIVSIHLQSLRRGQPLYEGQNK